MDRTNSMGLWTYAKSYLDAAKVVAASNQDLPPVPAYYLVCHSIELVLKAFLRGAGKELETLRQIGHNLIRCIEKAEAEGINTHYRFTLHQKSAVELINDYYHQKELEYISTGSKKLPEYKILEAIADGLLVSLKDSCRCNMHLHG